ncbi:hypothetical protein [Pseudonocardia sp. ICBG601]|uniref:hypothetical protein n=1 Tax=Pseudonocardia sp. ICBG601 TaxID=2846759 RepID=UPI001CF6D6B9|nr:hypothetical protein [Pseudonocardia sp. ICBG601]
MFLPRRFMSEPPLSPSAAGLRALRAVREVIEVEEIQGPGVVQRAVDLIHVHRVAYEAIDPALYVAVRGTRSVTFERMAELAGMSRSTVQVRVDNADPLRPSRAEKGREYRRRAAARRGEDEDL